MTERTLAAAWVCDSAQWRRENAQQRQYWDLYIGEMCAQIGLSADAIGPEQLLLPATLARYSTLLLGGIDLALVGPAATQRLHDWVSEGGTLVGLACLGADALFGIGGGEPVPAQDPFASSATITARDHAAWADITPFFAPGQPLLAFGPTRSVICEAAEDVADLSSPTGLPLGAAVTLRRVGEGRAIYFAFALPQTLWVLHQGRPIDRDYDGDGYYRTGDSFVIGDGDIEVPYADHLIWLVENLIFAATLPSIYALPPVQGRAPVAAVYFVGDDEGATTGQQVRASDFMRSIGLPYHLNVMAQNGEFGFTPEDAAHFRGNGHDFSLHYNFVPSSGFHSGTEFTADDVRAQADLYRERFGERPYASVNHWLRWTGWAEPARWMAEVGGRGDGSFVHARMPPLNPVDIFGFPFGTSYPFRFYEDWQRGNERLEFVEKPITGYEMGYSADANDFTQLHRLLDMSRAQHLMTSLFCHSGPIADLPTSREALAESVRYTKAWRRPVAYMSLTGVVTWWLYRLASAVTGARVDEHGFSAHVSARAAQGVVVRLPLGSRRVARARLDGATLEPDIWGERGQTWLMIAVPQGDHLLEVDWQ